MRVNLRRLFHWSLLAALLLAGGVLLSASNIQAKPMSAWSSPTGLSGWLTEVSDSRLELGADGTQAAMWISGDPLGGTWAIWGRQRTSGQPWNTGVNISLQQPKLSYYLFWDAGITPDGTLWVVWTGKDDTISGDNMFAYAAWRTSEGSWQRTKLSSIPAGTVRDLRLAIGPEGLLLVTWADSDSVGQPPFSLHAVMRYPDAPDWEPVRRIDANYGNTYIKDVYPLVGPEGMAMVLWVESKPSDPWVSGVFWRVYDPGTGNWSVIPTVPISKWHNTNWLDMVKPVMGPDGTVVAAWRNPSPPNPNNLVNNSATRTASSGTWSPEVPISTPRPNLSRPILALSENGTSIAAWLCQDGSNNRYGVCVNARDPGSAWEGDTVLFGWQAACAYIQVGVWPDGGAMVVWDVRDTSQPTTQDWRKYWSLRPPGGPWGAFGPDPIGDWMDGLFSVNLKMSADDYAYLVWSAADAAQPAGLTNAVFASAWIPGASWEAPTRISSWDKDSFGIFDDGLVVAPDGQTVAALWIEERTAAPKHQVFYNQIDFLIASPGQNVYLPLVIKHP